MMRGFILWCADLYYYARIYIMMRGFILCCADLYYDARIYIMMRGFILWCADLYYDARIYIMMHGFILWCTDLYYDARIYIMMRGFILWCADLYYDARIHEHQGYCFRRLLAGVSTKVCSSIYNLWILYWVIKQSTISSNSAAACWWLYCVNFFWISDKLLAFIFVKYLCCIFYFSFLLKTIKHS